MKFSSRGKAKSAFPLSIYSDMTMVLIVSRPIDAHVDYLLPKIQQEGGSVRRLFLEDFPAHKHIELSIEQEGLSGTIITEIEEFELQKITSVWVRPIGNFGVSETVTDDQNREFILRESQSALDGLFSVLNCRWINHPVSLRVADNKIYQLQTAQKLGFRVPKTLITQNPERARSFFYSCNRRMIVKPFRSFSFRSNDGALTAIPTHLVSATELAQSPSIALCPTLLQEYIEKEFELRVTVIGKEIFACAIHSQEHDLTAVDWRLGVNSELLRYSRYQLPERVSELCFSLNEALGLSYSAIDIIKTPEGDYVFLEANPNGQWLWIEEKVGFPISNALTRALLQG